jgi:putative AlgH/UPF0301 family transcriptional regulator
MEETGSPTAGEAMPEKRKEVSDILGLRLYAADGQSQATRNRQMVLVGGPVQAEQIQMASARFSEILEDRDKRLSDAFVHGITDTLPDAAEKGR